MTAMSTRVSLTLRQAVIAAGLLALAVALPSLANGFVYDDVWIIEDRPLVHDGTPRALATAPFWPEDRGGAMWRPGAMLAFAAQWAPGDGSPLVFHAVNAGVYAAIGALAALLIGLLVSPLAGLLGGVLFAVHPVHVEALANVVGQTELLPALCYVVVLLAALRMLRAAGRARLGWIVAAAMATAVGMSFKEHMVTLPAAIPVVWWLAARREGGAWRDMVEKGWPALVAVLVPVAAYLALRAGVTGSVADAGGVAPGLDGATVVDRIVVMLPVSLHWLRLLFFPVALSAEYGPDHLVPRPEPTLLHVAAFSLWSAILILAWHVRRHVPALAAGAALFLVTISVVSNVVVPLEVLLAERFLLIPSLGWALAIGGAGAWAATAVTVRDRRVLAGVFVVVVALLGARTVARVGVWRSNDVFFARMEQDAPRSFRNFWRQGAQAFDAGDSLRGERLYLQAVSIHPTHPGLLEELGLIYASAGRFEPAARLFGGVLTLDSNRANALMGLAVARTKTGQAARALPLIDRFVALYGETYEVVLARVEALRNAGRFQASVAAAEATMERWPEDWYLHLMAAESAVMGGLCVAALEHADAGSRKAPENSRNGFVRVREHVAKGDAACK